MAQKHMSDPNLLYLYPHMQRQCKVVMLDGCRVISGKRYTSKSGSGWTVEPVCGSPELPSVEVALRVREHGLRGRLGSFVVLARVETMFATSCFIMADELASSARYQGRDVWPDGVNGVDGRVVLDADGRRGLIEALRNNNYGSGLMTVGGDHVPLDTAIQFLETMNLASEGSSSWWGDLVGVSNVYAEQSLATS